MYEPPPCTPPAGYTTNLRTEVNLTFIPPFHETINSYPK